MMNSLLQEHGINFSNSNFLKCKHTLRGFYFTILMQKSKVLCSTKGNDCETKIGCQDSGAGQPTKCHGLCRFGVISHEISSCCAQCFDSSHLRRAEEHSIEQQRHVAMSTHQMKRSIVHKMKTSFLLHQNTNSKSCFQ